MPVRVTADQAASKWQQRLSASTQQITDGVNAVTVSPGQKAAQAADLWLQRVQAARNKYQTNVGRVTLSDWQAAMISKGIPRISAGATAGQPKMQAFMTQFLPFLANGVAQIERMPKGSLDQSIARATAMIQYNAGFKRSGA